MIAKTHRLISLCIVEDLKTRGIIQLDRAKFEWGSVKPDFVLPPFRKKHYMAETLDEIVIMIHALANKDNQYSIAELSERIGEVTHFVTDFFCLPHSERWEFIKSGRTIEHIRYEKKLHQLMEGSIYNPTSVSFEPELNDTSIKMWILYYYDIYRLKTDYAHDFQQALAICLAITEWIVLQRKHD